MKHIILRTLSFFILFSQTQAFASEGFKRAFDELEYALTVESDGTNKSIQDAASSKFYGQIHKLGLSSAEMIELLKTEISNKGLLQDLETLHSIASIGLMSEKELMNLISQAMKKSYAQGASWNQKAIFPLMGVALVVIVAIIASSSASSSRSSDDPDYVVPEECKVFPYCNPYCRWDYTFNVWTCTEGGGL